MTRNETTDYTTSVGRFVNGKAFEPFTHDINGELLTIKKGPNAGKNRLNFYLGLAIDKNEPKCEELWNTIKKIAIIESPNLTAYIQNLKTPADISGSEFAFKIADGDSSVENMFGKAPRDREGYPGHWIINFNSISMPKFYVRENGLIIQTIDRDKLKRGDYVRIHCKIKGNSSSQKPGIFWNASMIMFERSGKEIASGPNPEEIFGDCLNNEPLMPVPVAPLDDSPIEEVKYIDHAGNAFTKEDLMNYGYTLEQIGRLKRA